MTSETVSLPCLDRHVFCTSDTDGERPAVWGGLSIDAFGELVSPEVDERVQVAQSGMPDIELFEGLDRRSVLMERVLHNCRHGRCGLR
jgi:hypothetical protein